MRKVGFYEKYVKRILDIICALAAIVVFGWLYIILAILVRIKMGSPIIFKQQRPGKNEKMFNMYKFRSMSNERDENGELLPAEERLNNFGKFLRKTSLDELPEAFNILKGDMSVIGPRPQLVKDMLFMTDEQRIRHTAKPGLSGLAQVNGRNAIDWDKKFEYDLKYIENITFWNDLKIVLKTVSSAFIKQEGADEENEDLSDDLCDYLLKIGRISKEEYEQKLNNANEKVSV